MARCGPVLAWGRGVHLEQMPLELLAQMTPESKHLAQESWERVLPDAGRFADLFIERLLELDPPLRHILAEPDPSEHGRRLVRALTQTVRNLDEEGAVPAGAAYAGDDARKARVGQALLWALERTLDGGLTDHARTAWTELFAAHGAGLCLAALGETAPLRGLSSWRRYMQAGS